MPPLRQAELLDPAPPGFPSVEGERHLRDFLKHANYLIQSTAMDGQLLFVNETWKRVLGYGDADLAAGLRMQDLLPEESRAAGRAVLDSITSAQGEREVEFTVMAKDGRRVQLAGEADCRIVDGVPVATRAIFRDVTAQRAAEARARAVELRHQAVVTVLGEGIAIISAEGIIEMANPSAERILGLRAADVVGRHLLEWPWRIVDEDGGELPREAHPALVALHTARPQADTVIGVCRGDTGERIWIAVNARPLVRPGEPRPHAAVVSFRDVTVQFTAQAALREREARFRGILETVRSIAICLDARGCLTFANDFLLELTGWRREDVLGDDWFERFVPPGDAVRGVFQDHLGKGTFPTYYENEIVTRTGERRTILWDTTVLRDDDGAFVGTASIGHDVTERRRVERLKDELIATASHELRTPLTAIRGALEVVLGGPGERGERGERERTLLGMAARNADRLDRLVSDLLDVERIESGAELLHPVAVAARQLAASAVESMRPVAERRGIALAMRGDDARVWADPDRIAQVLVNLLGNALKFSTGGTVTVSWSAEGDDAWIAVGDEGPGIPEDKLESIFEPFVQVQAAGMRSGSAGLGLAISRAIVVQHQGRIWAESEGEGRGTTVTFSLPLAKGE